jgi:hypothetical protein
MESIVVLFADSMALLDSMFRRRVSSVIPDYSDLVADPASFLSAQEVRIGPGNRYASGVLLGTLLGLILSCGVGWGLIGNGEPLKKMPVETKALVIANVILGTLGTVGAILYWLRGGELILHKDGVDFRFRRRTVKCPWRVFSAPGRPAWLDRFTLALPVEPDAIRDVVLLVNGEETASGRDIRTKQFRFRLDSRPRVTNSDHLPEVSIRDLYRAKLSEIGALLLEIGSEMSN